MEVEVQVQSIINETGKWTTSYDRFEEAISKNLRKSEKEKRIIFENILNWDSLKYFIKIVQK